MARPARAPGDDYADLAAALERGALEPTQRRRGGRRGFDDLRREFTVDVDCQLWSGGVQIALEADQLRVYRRGLQNVDRSVRQLSEDVGIFAHDLDADRRPLGSAPAGRPSRTSPAAWARTWGSHPCPKCGLA